MFDANNPLVNISVPLTVVQSVVGPSVQDLEYNDVPFVLAKFKLADRLPDDMP